MKVYNWEANARNKEGAAVVFHKVKERLLEMKICNTSVAGDLSTVRWPDYEMRFGISITRTVR